MEFYPTHLEQYGCLLKADIDDVATLHKTVFRNTLFAKYGIRILQHYYQEVFESRKTFSYICKRDTEIIGVIVGSVDLPGFRWEIIRHRGIKILCVLLTKPATILWSLSHVFKSLSLVPKKYKTTLPTECLLVIFVSPSYSGKGVATTLLRHLEHEMVRRTITRFSVQTEQCNVAATEFYTKNGFELVGLSAYQNLYVRDLSR